MSESNRTSNQEVEAALREAAIERRYNARQGWGSNDLIVLADEVARLRAGLETLATVVGDNYDRCWMRVKAREILRAADETSDYAVWTCPQCGKRFESVPTAAEHSHP